MHDIGSRGDTTAVSHNQDLMAVLPVCKSRYYSGSGGISERGNATVERLADP